MNGVVLITGTSTGIGQAAAVAMAASGYQVVATMRNTDRATALVDAAKEAGVSLDIRALDVTDDASVNSCVDAVIADYGQLDAVINNAGAGHIGTVETDSVADFQAVCDLNLFGVVRVTKAVMPHLRASQGRLITVSSVGGVIGQPFNEAYCAAKFGVEGMMESVAALVSQFGVKVSIVEPGPVTSAFRANAVSDREALFAQLGDYREAALRYAQRSENVYSVAQTSEEVAVVLLRVLNSPEPAFRYQTSEWSAQFVKTKLADPDGSIVLGITAGMC